MTAMDETAFFGMDQGCPIHGDEYMIECSMCGTEFCRLCHPKSSVCPDCATEDDEDLEEGDLEEADFDDVENVGDILEGEDSEDDKE